MRTCSDWRDLPPVPRVGASVRAPQPDTNARKRQPESNASLDSDSEEEIFVPRKRARHGAFGQSAVQNGSPPPSNSVTKSAHDSDRAASRERAASRLSDGNTSLGTDYESSDEEAVLRVIRRRRKRVSTSRSSSLEGASRSRSKSQSSRRQRTGSSDAREGRHRSSTGSKKRRRPSSPGRDEEREVSKRRRSDGTVSKPRNDFVEAMLAESSPVSESDSMRRGSSSGGARGRRCARQSTGSVSVPWYLLDEERRPRRLRASSRNCAARCVYWARTEHRLFYIAQSRIHNRGLYASQDIPAFVPVIEYAGEVVTQVQSEIREWAYQTRHMDEVYMYQLRKGTTNVIDGTLRGGPAKFVNHSCEPNVVAEEIHAGGTNRVWFFSLRPIRKHEEILVDYCLSYEPGDVKRPCKCGARACKKFLNYYGLTE